MNWKKIGKTELMFLMIFMGANIASLSALACIEISKVCKTSADCCDGCCLDGMCTMSEKCMMETNHCSTYLCPPSTVCRLQKVHCFRAPCPHIPTCQLISDGNN